MKGSESSSREGAVVITARGGVLNRITDQGSVESEFVQSNRSQPNPASLQSRAVITMAISVKKSFDLNQVAITSDYLDISEQNLESLGPTQPPRQPLSQAKKSLTMLTRSQMSQHAKSVEQKRKRSQSSALCVENSRKSNGTTTAANFKLIELPKKEVPQLRVNFGGLRPRRTLKKRPNNDITGKKVVMDDPYGNPTQTMGISNPNYQSRSSDNRRSRQVIPPRIIQKLQKVKEEPYFRQKSTMHSVHSRPSSVKSNTNKQRGDKSSSGGRNFGNHPGSTSPQITGGHSTLPAQPTIETKRTTDYPSFSMRQKYHHTTTEANARLTETQNSVLTDVKTAEKGINVSTSCDVAQQNLEESTCTPACFSRPATGEGLKRPRSIPPAMKGYIMNHVGRIVELTSDEIRQQRTNSLIKCQCPQHQQGRVKTMVEQQTGPDDLEMFKVGETELFNSYYNNQPSLEQTKPENANPIIDQDKLINLANLYRKNSGGVHAQSDQVLIAAIQSSEMSRQSSHMMQPYMTKKRKSDGKQGTGSSSIRSGQHNMAATTPQFYSNLSHANSGGNHPREDLVKQAAINNQDKHFDFNKSIKVTKIGTKNSTQITSAEQTISLDQHQFKPVQSPNPRNVSVGAQQSNNKVTTEVFLSKVKMLSPDSKVEHPNVSAFLLETDDAKSRKSSKSSKKGLRKSRLKSATKPQKNREDMLNIGAIIAIENYSHTNKSNDSHSNPVTIKRSSDHASSHAALRGLSSQNLAKMNINLEGSSMQKKLQSEIVNISVQSATGDVSGFALVNESERQIPQSTSPSLKLALMRNKRPMHSAIPQTRAEPRCEPVYEVDEITKNSHRVNGHDQVIISSKQATGAANSNRPQHKLITDAVQNSIEIGEYDDRGIGITFQPQSVDHTSGKPSLNVSLYNKSPEQLDDFEEEGNHFVGQQLKLVEQQTIDAGITIEMEESNPQSQNHSLQTDFRRSLPVRTSEKQRISGDSSNQQERVWKAQKITEIKMHENSSSRISRHSSKEHSKRNLQQNTKRTIESCADLAPVLGENYIHSASNESDQRKMAKMKTFQESDTKKYKSLRPVSLQKQESLYPSTLMNTVESPFLPKKRGKPLDQAALIKVTATARKSDINLRQSRKSNVKRSGRFNNSREYSDQRKDHMKSQHVNKSNISTDTYKIADPDHVVSMAESPRKIQLPFVDARLTTTQSADPDNVEHETYRDSNEASNERAKSGEFPSMNRIPTKFLRTTLSAVRATPANPRQSQRLLKRGSNPMDNLVVGQSLKKCSRPSTQQQIAQYHHRGRILRRDDMTSIDAINSSNVKGTAAVTTLQNVKTDNNSQTTIDIESQRKLSVLNPQGLDQLGSTLCVQTENQSIVKSVGVGVEAPQTFIAVVDYNSSASGVGGAYNSALSRQERVAFLNKQERTKLQQKNMKRMMEIQATRGKTLLARPKKPVSDEEQHKKLKGREACRRDIKFACRRSTSYIRTKLQKQIDQASLLGASTKVNQFQTHTNIRLVAAIDQDSLRSSVMRNPVAQANEGLKVNNTASSTGTGDESFVIMESKVPSIAAQTFEKSGGTDLRHHIIPTSKFGQVSQRQDLISSGRENPQYFTQPYSVIGTQQNTATNAYASSKGLGQHEPPRNDQEGKPLTGGVQIISNDADTAHFSTERLMDKAQLAIMNNAIKAAENPSPFTSVKQTNRGEAPPTERSRVGNAGLIKSLQSVISANIPDHQTSGRNSSSKTFFPISNAKNNNNNIPIVCESSDVPVADGTESKSSPMSKAAKRYNLQRQDPQTSCLVSAATPKLDKDPLELEQHSKSFLITGLNNQFVTKTEKSEIASHLADKSRQGKQTSQSSIVLHSENKHRPKYSGMLKLNQKGSSYPNSYYVHRQTTSLSSKSIHKGSLELKRPYAMPAAGNNNQERN